MAGDLTSSVQQLDNAFGYSVQANYATVGSLGGTLSLEASIDHQQDSQGNVLVAGNWVTVTNSSQTISGAGSYIWNVENVMYPYFRVKYAHHSGDTGTLNVYCNVRGF
jgi:hypothetical protein